MEIKQLYFAFAGVSLLLALNTHWSVRDKRVPLFSYLLTIISFFSGWILSELALHALILGLALHAYFIAMGALSSPLGYLSAAMGILATVFLWKNHHQARSSQVLVAQALSQKPALHAAADPLLSPPPFKRLALPFPIRKKGIVRHKNIPFSHGENYALKLDVYVKDAMPKQAPILLYIHGGGWVMGSKNDQGLPLMNHMAARGWVCVNADYRLAPKHKFPAPVIDIKRAIQWIRAHIEDYGGDPNYIVIAGGSAGGHLASLVATSQGDPQFQPGFEKVNTRLRGCISLYGIYDLTNSNGVWHRKTLIGLVQRFVLQKKLRDHPEDFRQASAYFRLGPDTPPFMVVHGTLDSLVPVDEARHFVQALKAQSPAESYYLEFPGAQHAFEIFPSTRTEWLLRGIERFLVESHGEWRAEQMEGEASSASA